MKSRKRLIGFLFLSIISLVLICSSTVSASNTKFEDITVFEEKESSSSSTKYIGRFNIEFQEVGTQVLSFLCFIPVEIFQETLVRIVYIRQNFSYKESLAKREIHLILNKLVI